MVRQDREPSSDAAQPFEHARHRRRPRRCRGAARRRRTPAATRRQGPATRAAASACRLRHHGATSCGPRRCPSATVRRRWHRRPQTSSSTVSRNSRSAPRRRRSPSLVEVGAQAVGQPTRKRLAGALGRSSRRRDWRDEQAAVPEGRTTSCRVSRHRSFASVGRRISTATGKTCTLPRSA